MHELEQKISVWRREIGAAESIDDDALRELESHLRDGIDGGLENGMTLPEAFDQAVVEIGETAQLETEFGKVYPPVSWARRLTWMVWGFGLISIILFVISIVQRGIEILMTLWFPGKTIPLPWAIEFDGPSVHFYQEGTYRLENVHVSVFASLFVVLALTLLMFSIGSRWIRGKTARLDRWISIDSTKKLLALILGSCALLMILRSSFFGIGFWMFPLGSSGMGETYYFGMTHAAHGALVQYFRSWLDLAVLALTIVFVFWAMFRLRKSGRRSSVAWMFAGFFVIGGLIRVAALSAALCGGVAMLIFPGLASRGDYVSVPPGLGFQTGAGLIAIVVLLGLCFALVVFAVLVASGRFARSASRLVAWFEKHTTLFAIIYFLPAVWSAAIMLLRMGSANYAIWESDSTFTWMALVSYATINRYVLTPFFALALAIAAGSVLFRELRASRGDQDSVSA